MNDVKYDAEKRTSAGKKMLLRLAVSVYIFYLAFKIASAEDTTMSVTACRIIGAVFVAAGIAFVIYTNKQFRREMKASVIADEAAETAEDAEAEEADDSEE